MTDNGNNSSDMQYVDDFKQRILEQYERMDENSEFEFNCSKGMKCFTACCGDVNIFLTPYCIIRMKNRLGISSQEFLEKYTINPFTKTQKLPSVLLKMTPETKRCQFVTDEGCSIYEDRPWACRMYPLGMASPGDDPATTGQEEFYFLMAEDVCMGVKEGGRKFKVSEWIENQGIAPYNEMGDLFKRLCLHKLMSEIDLTPQKMEMFYTAVYNIDQFRRFIRESRFRLTYEFSDRDIEEITSDDVKLFKFAVRWLLFGLFNEPTIKIRDEVVAAKRKAMGMDDKD